MSSENDNFGDEIVVSGMAGRFPNSANVNEFEHNLFNKIDMADEQESRFKHFNPEVPSRTGKVGNLEKFDASFFSFLSKHANQMDPQCRILLEHSYEAILDSGTSPSEVFGSKTGVFIGCSNSDSSHVFTHTIPTRDGWAFLGNATFNIPNRISYALGFTGPSFIIDTACSSTAYALDSAYKSIMNGSCDAAIVGGSQLMLSFCLNIEFTRCGILAQDGYCRPFDKNASGFSRADAIGVVYLQKRKDAKRMYAQLVYTKSNNDGFKKEGSSFPSRIMQQKLMEEFFLEAKVDPADVGYVEAHATGTNKGDPEEVAAIDEVFCKNKDRSEPLLIGSVKSNMGHAESASALASITKILLGFEKGQIPPNINLTTDRDDVPAFAEKRIRVVKDTEDLKSPYVAMNSFGLGGANAHALFKRNLKQKINNSLPTDDLPRLVLWSGRSDEAVKSIFDDLTSRPLDTEYVGLLHNSQRKTNPLNVMRGYGIFNHNAETGKAECKKSNIALFNTETRPIVFVYTGMGCQWPEMGRDLMKIPTFADTINKCHAILAKRGVDLLNILTTKDEKIFDNILNSYVGITSIEVALTDVLKSLNIKPDYIIGHSLGELGCAYADGCFTLEEVILATHARGEASLKSENIAGAMAAIGMNYQEVAKILPEDIDIACHNSVDSTTVSGPAESVKAFVAEMAAKNTFAKEVACSGIPLHSRYIKQMGKNLKQKLDEIIKSPKKRSSKWLSSSFHESKWSSHESQFSSSDYHTQNLLNPVLFEEVLAMVPENALTIEIAPHHLLRSILKRSIKQGAFIGLAQRNHENGCEFLMEELGKLFENGADIDVAKLYPAIDFPVSANTPKISPLIKWEHSDDHFVTYFDAYDFYERHKVSINLNDKAFESYQDHIIDGRIIVPAAGYLNMVWDTFSMMCSRPPSTMKVVFESVEFLRATSLKKNQDCLLNIIVNRASGKFEITEGRVTVCRGTVRQGTTEKMTELVLPPENPEDNMNAADFYKEMRIHGYQHRGVYRGVEEIYGEGRRGKLLWNNNWTAFIDFLVQYQAVYRDTRMLVLPRRMRQVILDPELHQAYLADCGEDKKIEFTMDPYLNSIRCGGVEIQGLDGSLIKRRQQSDPVMEAYRFVPYSCNEKLSSDDAAKVFIQLALENYPKMRVTSIEVDSNDETKAPFAENISHALNDLPSITHETIFLSSKSIELDHVSVQDNAMSAFSNAHFLIASKVITDASFIQEARSVLDKNGYIISRESGFELQPCNDLEIVARIRVDDEVLFMLQFADKEKVTPVNVIKITSEITDWLEPLKAAVKSGPTIAYCQTEPLSGILGLINCIRQEPNNEPLYCVFIDDASAPEFSVDKKFYQMQLRLGLHVNVLRGGEWGCYRHLAVAKDLEEKPRSGHYFINVLSKGDLSSLAWMYGSLNIRKPKRECIKISYASLNFRDVMLATGKIQLDDIFDRIEQQCTLGLEFSGVDSRGKRVMGFVFSGALATHYELGPGDTIWEVPDKWTLAEAATLPCAYYTVYKAFFFTAEIKRGESILIHSGTGAVGTAAIQTALCYGLDVYTTVGSAEKREYLLKRFPQLNPDHIGNSRDTSFEYMIAVQTKGRGVDYVLNSLAGDLLQASIRCLAAHGTFLEIGKYDIMNNTKIDMGHFARKVTFKAVFINNKHEPSDQDPLIIKKLTDDISTDVAQPLKTNVFNANEGEKAFRFMASGKHIGKVLLKVRENMDDLMSLPIAVKPQVHCNPEFSYVLVGGLGGFGMELADFLVLRGCMKLVLSSSRGLSNGYQRRRIRLWKTYGVEIVVTTADVKTYSGCEQLIKEAAALGPIGGIFNLAVALRDGIFENQTEQLFNESLAVKSVATEHLDTITRKVCSPNTWFVVFSSVSCGRGNAGQTNYGMANSIMERIVERRVRDGYHGKAIQWGAISDVGLLADLQEKNVNVTIGGTLPQNLTSCMQVIDDLLVSKDAIVSSMIVAEKKFDDGKKGNIIDVVLNIMSIHNKKSLSMDATFSSLGLDSLMGVEIQQILERDYDVVISAQELRSMTLGQLEKQLSNKDSFNKRELSDEVRMLITNFGDEATADQPVLKLESRDTKKGKKVLILPGFEGVCNENWRNFAKNIDYPTYILQSTTVDPTDDLDVVVAGVKDAVLKLFSDDDEFLFCAYSFGCTLALKLIKLLEARNKKGSLVMIDGSPVFSRAMSYALLPQPTEENIQNYILLNFIRVIKPKAYEDATVKIMGQPTWEKKLDAFVAFAKGENQSYGEVYGRRMLTSYVYTYKMALKLETFEHPVIEKTPMKLFKASIGTLKGLDEDYGLSNQSKLSFEIESLEEDHFSIFTNQKVIDRLNEAI